MIRFRTTTPQTREFSQGFDTKQSVTQKPVFESVAQAMVHFQQFPFENNGAVYGSDFSAVTNCAGVQQYQIVPRYLDKLQVADQMTLHAQRLKEYERLSSARNVIETRKNIADKVQVAPEPANSEKQTEITN